MRAPILLAALVLACASCAKDEPPPPELATSSLLAPRVRRLSHREYRRAISDLVGIELPASRFPEEPVDVPFDNGPALLEVSGEQATLYMDLAEEIAHEALQRDPARIAPPCVPPGASPSPCRDALLDVFAPRAYRRPLRPDERARLASVFDGMLALGTTSSAASEATVAAALQAPGFLYREELGSPVGDHRELDAWETASSLSFFLTGGAPDTELQEAARRGLLASPEGRRVEARRLLSSPHGREALRAFIEKWLALDRMSTLTKDRGIYPEFGPELAASMAVDLRRTLDEIVASRGSLETLLTTRSSYPDARLARLYGIDAPASGARVELDGSLRAGLLTRAGLLAAHSSADGSGPIGRGLFVRGALLCASLPPPPQSIDRNVPRSETKTTRQRFSEHTSNPSCQGCHVRIDGAGFGFESFDGTGRHRLYEGGEPVDASGALFDADRADGEFHGVVELERRLLSSRALPSCFVRQVYRDAFGKAETSEEEPAIAALSTRIDARTPLEDLFLELVVSETFVRRKSE